MKSSPSRSEKKTDEEAREELQKPSMAALDSVMRDLIKVPHEKRPQRSTSEKR
jgi:hypothetical protein